MTALALRRDMSGIRVAVLAVLLLLMAAAPGCRFNPFHRRPASANVPPPPPKPVVTQPVQSQIPPRTEIAVVPEPPELSPPPDLNHPPKLPPQRVPPYRRPRHARETARRQPTAPVAAAPAAPAEGTPSAASVPQLEQILTPQQQQDYNESIDRNIGRAQRTVDQLNGKSLNRDQVIYLERIRAYIQQATEARKTDLFRARDLAERASVLAEDLWKSVQ